MAETASNDNLQTIEIKSEPITSEVIKKDVVTPTPINPRVIADKPPAEHDVEVVEQPNTDFLCQEFHTTMGVWSLLTGVMCIVLRLVDALKKYATELAGILVGAMLGGAIARFGRNIIRRAMGIISI